MNESQYQTKLIKKIYERLPGCVVLKNNPHYLQGVPDIIILYRDRWAMLEVKMSGEASIQPNQNYYIGMLDDMSFASFINPQNEEDVLHDLQSALGFDREARIS